MERRDLLQALGNKEEQEIPVSFWHHYAKDEFIPANTHSEMVDVNVAGHRQYVDEVDPDFVKLMTDGYFQYRFRDVNEVQRLYALPYLKRLPDVNEWLTGQSVLIKKQRQVIGDKYSFYNVFSPVTLLKWALVDETQEPLTTGDQRIADLYERDPERLYLLLREIAADVKKLVDVAIDSGANGIYYSTQSVQDARVDNLDFFTHIQKAIDLEVITEINLKTTTSILHICGFDQAKNHLEWFTDYTLPVINWSTHVDDCSLGEGKKLFGDRVVFGGFGITTQDILYRGTKRGIQREAERLVNEAGTTGVLIGADCTIKRDTPVTHIRWAEEAVHNLTK